MEKECDWIQPARGWCATVNRDCANCIHLIQSRTNTKTLLQTLTQSPTLTKYTNSPVQPSQTSPAHSPTSVQSPLTPLQYTPTYHRASIQLHTLIYLKQTTYWTSGCRPGGWCLCWPGGKDAWQGCLNLLGYQTPPQLHMRGGSTTITGM